MTDPSEHLALGTVGPGFDLPTVDGGSVALADLAADVVCVMFLCAHCPYVVHVQDELGRLAAAYGDRVDFVGVCSNDPAANPQDAPPGLRAQAAAAGWTFPYAVDGDSSVGRAYGAACTPDFFVLDAGRRLAYRGAMDGSSPGNGLPNDGAALRDALDLLLRGEAVPEPHLRPMGCAIDWVG